MRGRVRFSLLGIAVLAACAVVRSRSCGERPLRIATYNIEQFGHAQKKTDMDRLVTTVAELDADVLAVQEIQNKSRFAELAARLSQGRRSYAFALSACGGRSEMQLGLLYDTARVRLSATRQYRELDPDDRGSCGGNERPGFAAQLDDGKRSFWILVVHLAAGGDRFERRKVQWRNAHAIANALGSDGTPVAILGDANSTGWLDGRFDERRFIEDQAEEAGKVVATRDLACSEYWQPNADERGALRVSLLDHVVAPRGFVAARSVAVHSFCRSLRCKPTDEKPDDYTNVSDHCPVTFDLERAPSP